MDHRRKCSYEEQYEFIQTGIIKSIMFKNFVLFKISGFSQRNDPVIAISLIAFLIPGNSPIFLSTALS